MYPSQYQPLQHSKDAAGKACQSVRTNIFSAVGADTAAQNFDLIKLMQLKHYRSLKQGHLNSFAQR